MTRITQTKPKTIIQFLLAVLLASLSLTWLSVSPAYAAAPPGCYPNTPLAELRLENSPLADHALGDVRLDFDYDGKTDVFSTVPEDGQYRWRFSSGARQPWQNLGVSGVDPVDLRFGDFNGDRVTDIFSQAPDGRWQVSFSGTAPWRPGFQDPDHTPLNELRFGKFDNDNKTDVFRIASNGQWQISSGASGPWQDLNSSNMGALLTDLRFGDFDGDGKTDTFRRRNGKVGLWQYSPRAAAGWQDLSRSFNALTSLRFGDFDGDGTTDAFRRTTDGRWQVSYGVVSGWQDLAQSSVELVNLRFGDFDGDGRTDVFSQAPGGRWRVSFGGTTTWQLNFATIQIKGGLLTCLTGASEPDRASFSQAISADGSKIVFSSDSDFSNQGIPQGQNEIWLYDGNRRELSRITTSKPGRSNRSATISADGSKIIFISDSDFNGQGIPQGQKEVWLYDVDRRDLRRITTSGPGRNNYSPAISADGSNIVFRSDADFNNQGIPQGQREIWLYDGDAQPGQNLSRLTTSGPGRNNYAPAINADGSNIVFESDADFNNQGIPEGQHEIWLYDGDAQPGQNLSRITTSGPDRNNYNPTISADGSKIVFESDADFNGEGIPKGQSEIWLVDMNRGGLSHITTASGPDRGSFSPAISADGSKIVFISDADFNNQGIERLQYEIWLYDLPDGNLSHLTTASDPRRSSHKPIISADGSNIVFQSDSDFLGLGLSSGQYEIWLFEVGPIPPSPNPTPTPEPDPGEVFTVYLPLVLK